MNIIFMGTPNFGRRILEELVKCHNVKLVVTQPDTFKGKKQIISPVKEFANEVGIEVFQPEKIRLDKERILSTPCDCIVTAAYGQIIPEDILNHPKYKCINVHGSLLPHYRGGAPIQRAIMNGDKETGITIMYMAKGMDSGDILEQKSINIEGKTADIVFEELASLGAQMINPFLKRLENGEVRPIKQNEDDVTFAYNITKEEEKIDFNQDAQRVLNKIRGLSSNPGAYFVFDSKVYKVYDGEVSPLQGKIGEIVDVTKDYVIIACKKDALKISSIKPEGKNNMSFRDFYNGKGKEIFIKSKEIK